MKIIVDAMGGDFAPLAPVKGALMAQEKYGVDIVLTGKTEEALSDLDKATSLKPQHAGAHEYFAEALEKSGKEIEAAIHYRIAEELRKKKK